MKDKKFTWHRVAENADDIGFATNNIAVVEVNGKKICIGKTEAGMFAFAYKCPHAGGILADGFIDALGNIVCPVHRYRYDLKNGRNISGEGYYLKHWPVDVRQDGVWVGLDESGFWNLFQ